MRQHREGIRDVESRQAEGLSQPKEPVKEKVLFYSLFHNVVCYLFVFVLFLFSVNMLDFLTR